jgi:hypothetical protein
MRGLPYPLEQELQRDQFGAGQKADYARLLAAGPAKIGINQDGQVVGLATNIDDGRDPKVSRRTRLPVRKGVTEPRWQSLTHGSKLGLTGTYVSDSALPLAKKYDKMQSIVGATGRGRIAGSREPKVVFVDGAGNIFDDIGRTFKTAFSKAGDILTGTPLKYIPGISQVGDIYKKIGDL